MKIKLKYNVFCVIQNRVISCSWHVLVGFHVLTIDYVYKIIYNYTYIIIIYRRHNRLKSVHLEALNSVTTIQRFLVFTVTHLWHFYSPVRTWQTPFEHV